MHLYSLNLAAIRPQKSSIKASNLNGKEKASAFRRTSAAGWSEIDSIELCFLIG